MTIRSALLAVPLACAAPAAAQSDSADGVRAAVAELFDGMRAADTARVRAVLHPALRLLTADAEGGVAETGADRFLDAVADAPVVLDERVGEVEVRTDGALATAWMPYRFYAGDRFSHCGTNAMHLVRDGAGGADGAGADRPRRRHTPDRGLPIRARGTGQGGRGERPLIPTAPPLAASPIPLPPPDP